MVPWILAEPSSGAGKVQDQPGTSFVSESKAALKGEWKLCPKNTGTKLKGFLLNKRDPI